MADKNNTKHQFAIYYQQTALLASSHKIEDLLSIDDHQLYHRIVNILRLSSGESYILFDQTYNMHVQLVSTHKKNGLTSRIISIHQNRKIEPHITFLLPLLKREPFEDALYSLTELGTSTIIPIITKKTHRSWMQSRDQSRLERIIHAASEQSKNFSYPSLETAQPLEHIIPQLSAPNRVFFDPHGQPLLPVIQEIKKKPCPIVLMVGPEADLLAEEKRLLQEHDFLFCSLTQTILRAQQAAAISLGIFRSLI